MATRADGTVIIDITADPKQAINGINNVEKSVNGLASAAKSSPESWRLRLRLIKSYSLGKKPLNLEAM